MQVETSLIAVPGISTVSPAFLCRLVDMCARHGWDPNGIALTISEESGFNPAAKNPGSSASGLIQFIDSTAASLGTTTAQIRSMTAEQQLPLVEKFFVSTLNGNVPSRPEDYFLAVLGKPNLIGQPDSTPVFVRGSSGYSGNPQIDLDRNGVITVGDARAYMQTVLNRAQGTVGVFPSMCYEDVSPPSTSRSKAPIAFAVGALVAAVGYGLYRAFSGRTSQPVFAPPDAVPIAFRRIP